MNEENTLPFVSVIIPAYNAAMTISNAIEAVLAQDYPSDRMEVIVVNDGSTDQTRDVVSNYPVRLICHSQNRGDSAARNTGANNANGEILATTDADDKVDKNWLKNLVKGYKESNVGAVVGSSHIEYDIENWQQRIIGELWICHHGSRKVETIYDHHGHIGRNKSSGSNQSFRKSVFEEVGGFDMGLTAGMEQDILWRIEQAGYRVVFEPGATVYICPRQRLRDFIERVYRCSKGGIAIYCKHPSKISVRDLFKTMFLPTLAILLGLKFSLNIIPLLYLLLVIMFSPLFFYAVKLVRIRQHIQKRGDLALMLIVRYAAFIAALIAIPMGLYDYVFCRHKR